MRYKNKHLMQCRKQAMHVDLGISSTCAYTREATSLNELHMLELQGYLPLARADVGGVDVPLLESCEPELDWSSRVAVCSTQDNLQPEVLVAGAALFRLVV